MSSSVVQGAKMIHKTAIYNNNLFFCIFGAHRGLLDEHFWKMISMKCEEVTKVFIYQHPLIILRQFIFVV
jgi:hypothetical protein